MLSIAYSWVIQACVLLSAAVTVAAMTVSGRAWKKLHNPVDLACAVATAGWLVYLLTNSAGFRDEGDPLSVFATRAGYQIAIVAVSFFLLVSASVTRLEIYAVWMAQGLGGLLLLAWALWDPLQQDLTYELWVMLNLFGAGVLSLGVGLNVYRLGTYRCWLALGGTLLGLAIYTENLLANNRLSLGTAPAEYVYVIFLLVLWLLITHRAGHPESAAPSTYNHQSETDFAAVAVAGERRRIAQDLHDGVGSQLVNILATLDAGAPQQQAVALALEQCLLDLKIMVDTIDTADDSVVDALGCLRYRVQHSLDKLGVRLVWKVEVEGPLQGFRGERAQQVLRITQECLSNVMRHARASAVEVICRYAPESESMLLEIRDNGRGIADHEPGQPMGKGLEGMRRRAHQLGGRLQIATKARMGTQVRLSVPLQVADAD